MDTFTPASPIDAFNWKPEPQAAALVRDTLDRFVADNAAARRLAEQMRDLTGTRLLDWVDHFALPASEPLTRRLREAGFAETGDAGAHAWMHPGGIFPAIRLGAGNRREMAIKVESASDFLFANGLESVAIEGEPLASLRRARIASEGSTSLWIVERHGDRGFDANRRSAPDSAALLAHGEAFLRRRRHFTDAADGFLHARAPVDRAIVDVGVDRAADLFFAAERAYWMRRNRAAQVQKARQDRLGLGWANHDHHTYRSSREHFVALMEFFEALGCFCRERFYAGDRAGWGAQVLEQPTAGIVVFADVDLSPEEVSGDFAHQPLAARDRLGTVGLWCGLHGEAFLEAGMHHLECQFDFDAEREQLKKNDVGAMAPFTFFPHLKQAFTEPDIWAVDPSRIQRLLDRRLITAEQADRFRREGAVGSHLEVLQRDDGYKGFNQTGISEIIQRTDPRHKATATVDTAA